MSGCSPKSEEIDIGGRSPRNVGGREQDRASRRLGLTHSLTSPRTPEPPKPELPSRPPPAQDSDNLPRPRSLSPRRTPAPPSVTGSALSARLERASFVRASNVPSGPPSPKTRARFSAKRGELDGEVEADNAVGDGAGAPAGPAVTPSGGTGAGGGGGHGVEEAVTPTPASGGRGGGGGGSGSRVTAMALAIESQRQQQLEQQDDETPVMTLPAVITAAQAAGLAAEKRMRDNRHRQPSPPPPTQAIAGEREEEDRVQAPAVPVGMGAKRVGRVRGRGTPPAQREETFVGPRSAAGSSDFANGSSVYGTGKSQIQASPQYWVPRKLSRSPLNKDSSNGRGGKAVSISPPTGSSRPLW